MSQSNWQQVYGLLKKCVISSCLTALFYVLTNQLHVYSFLTIGLKPFGFLCKTRKRGKSILIVRKSKNNTDREVIGDVRHLWYDQNKLMWYIIQFLNQLLDHLVFIYISYYTFTMKIFRDVNVTLALFTKAVHTLSAA